MNKQTNKQTYTNLLDPCIHEEGDIYARGFAESSPQILGTSVLVSVPLNVDADTLQEHIQSEEGAQHANAGRTLVVTDGIKDLVDLVGMLAGYLDGMAASKSIQCQTHLESIRNKVRPVVPFREEL